MTALRLPPFGSPSKFPRLSSLESTWEVESEIFGNEFSVSLVRGVLALTHFPALFHFNGHMFFDCTGCRIAHPASDRLVIECSPKSYAMHRGLVGVQFCIALIWFASVRSPSSPTGGLVAYLPSRSQHGGWMTRFRSPKTPWLIRHRMPVWCTTLYRVRLRYRFQQIGAAHDAYHFPGAQHRHPLDLAAF